MREARSLGSRSKFHLRLRECQARRLSPPRAHGSTRGTFRANPRYKPGAVQMIAPRLFPSYKSCRMAIRTIWPLALPIVFYATAAWAQAPPANVNPCQPQQQAAAAPPPAFQPVQPQESGAPPLPVPQNQRLSKREKFKFFVRYTYSPYTFAGAGFNAGMAQATGGWHSYGGGMQGYGKRYAAALADTESGAFFGGFLFPVLLQEDPRYLRSTSRNTMPRIGYALSRVLVTHDEHGNKKPNLSLILGAFASSGLANAYYPREDRGVGDTAARVGNGLLSTAEMNLLREFWPDISRKIRKHEPKRLQKLEQSPRIKKIEQMMLGPVAPPPCSPAKSQPEQTDNH